MGSPSTSKGDLAVVYRISSPAEAVTDAELVAALRRGEDSARAAIYDRFAPHVRRVLARVLGTREDLRDRIHDVFVQVYGSVHQIDDPHRLRAWVTSVTVNTARGWIRRRKRRRWLTYMTPTEVPDRTYSDPHDCRDALQRTYAILEELPADERIAFALRFIDQMSLQETADACGVSLATIKRRLRVAGDKVRTAASTDPVLCTLLGGER